MTEKVQTEEVELEQYQISPDGQKLTLYPPALLHQWAILGEIPKEHQRGLAEYAIFVATIIGVTLKDNEGEETFMGQVAKRMASAAVMATREKVGRA